MVKHYDIRCCISIEMRNEDILNFEEENRVLFMFQYFSIRLAVRPVVSPRRDKVFAPQTGKS